MAIDRWRTQKKNDRRKERILLMTDIVVIFPKTEMLTWRISVCDIIA